MGLLGGIVSFLLIWWMILFMTLPLRIHRQNPGDRHGSDPGAPDHPHLKYKIILTTILSLVLWGILYTLIQTGVLTYEIWL